MARAAGRRWALAGLGLAALMFAGSGRVLQEQARAEPLRVEVAAPLTIAAKPDGLRWVGRPLPAELAPRLTAQIDGAPAEAVLEDGHLRLDLAGAGPGHHLVELTLAQRGGRTQTVTDALLVGPFARRGEVSPGTGCAASLTIADAAIQRLLVPVVRERLLAAAAATPLLGPGTVLERAELTLLKDSVRGRVALAGVNRIAVDAYLQVRPSGPRGLAMTLVWLGPVEFSGELRTRATVGGAAVGAALTGPLAPLGAIGGYVLTSRYVDRRAREEVRSQIRQGLAQLEALPLLPARAELLIGEPRSAVEPAFCGPVTIAAGAGISARLSLRPLVVGDGATPGPVVQGVALPEEPVPGDMSGGAADVRVDLSIDAVNAVLDAWTTSGLLAERISGDGWVPQVDAELQAWTRLTLAALHVDRPPVVMPAGQGAAPPDGAALWALSFGGLRLDLRGGDAPGSVIAAGRGWIRPRFDPDTGTLELGGQVDRLRLTCVQGTTLSPCFGALLELGDVAARLDAALSPGTGRLPSLDLRGLLQARTRALRPEGLDVAALALTVPDGHPGVLRVTARLR
jgi:hypothetical protein